MATIKFGAKQFNNPTPANVSNAVSIITVVASILLTWIGTASFIPAGISSTLQSILGLVIALSNGIKPFFGVQTEKENVPIEQVTAMEAEPKS